MSVIINNALFIVLIFLSLIIIAFLFVIIRALSKQGHTVDDPTGKKKQQIFDDLVRAIDDVKSTV